MKTTEIFVEQVLIGFLVLIAGGLMFWGKITYAISSIGGDITIRIASGALLVGLAYLVGMVYDRVADTLLEDIEQYHRLGYAGKRLKRATRKWQAEEKNARGKKIDGLLIKADIFPEDKYRILIMKSPGALDREGYLRTRIRLLRSFCTLLPAISWSLLFWQLKYDIGSALWNCGAIALPSVYLAAFFIKIIPYEDETKHWYEKVCNGIRGGKPPKTNKEFKRLSGFLRKVEPKAYCSDGTPSPMWRFVIKDRVCQLWALLIAFGAIVTILSPKNELLWVLVIGIVLTFIVGWCWWRICETYFSFLDRFSRYSGDRKRNPLTGSY